MSAENKELLSPKHPSRAAKLICQLRTQSWQSFATKKKWKHNFSG